MSISLLLQAGTAAGADGQAVMGSGLSMFVPLILIVLIMYFLMIRPQNKKQKETEKMIAALKKGDKVVTIGGIHGVVSSTKENTVIVKVEDGAKIEFNRTAIANVIVDKPAAAEDKTEKTEKKGLFGFGKKKAEVAKEIKESDNAEAAEAESEEADK